MWTRKFSALNVALAVLVPGASALNPKGTNPPVSAAGSSREIRINGVDIKKRLDGTIFFQSGATLDADGANGQFGGPVCCAPGSYKGKTLDSFNNACPSFIPLGRQSYVQQTTGPNAGAYISMTRLVLPIKERNQHRIDRMPERYVDAATVPYVSVPKSLLQAFSPLRSNRKTAILGSLCKVTNVVTGKSADAVVADKGSDDTVGEISYACAKKIGLDTGAGDDCRNGGTRRAIIQYTIYPGRAAMINGVKYPLQPGQ